MSSLIVEVREITNIEPHPNADRLEIATVGGWQCIVGKDNHQVGEAVIFIPPDSILPQVIIDEFSLEFVKNGRVKAVRLRGVMSFGLILPNFLDAKVGTDVARALGITKWEVPEPAVQQSGGKVRASRKRMNPHLQKYTDIENVRNFQGIFTPGEVVVVTEKVHGTNLKMGYLPVAVDPGQPWWYRLASRIKILLSKKYEFVLASNNVQLHAGSKTYYESNVWERAALRTNARAEIPDGYMVYGEVYGAGVQDLTYGLTKDIDFVVFDVMFEGKYLNFNDALDFCWMHNFTYAPIMYVGEYYDGLIGELTDGASLIAPTQIREGIVIKPIIEGFHPRLGRKILKSVSSDYLTRKGGTEFH